MGLLSNKRAFAVLQTLAKRLLFAGDRGIESVRALGFSLQTFEWKLEEMPSEVLSPRRANSVYVLLCPVVRHVYSDSHGLLTTPKLEENCHQPLVATDGPKVSI